MSSRYLTMDDIDLRNKTVLVRVDINSPVDPEIGKILDSTRMRAHLDTLRALSKAKTVLVAHQSRPGKKDFTSLMAHAERLTKLLGRPVMYVDSLFATGAKRAILALEPGDILLLENVRYYSEETNLKGDMETLAETHFIKQLSPLIDIFINDAFAASHRATASMIGFVPVLPSVAGKLMDKELGTLHKVVSGAERPAVAFLGGAKADDSVRIARNMLEQDSVDDILTGGVVANIFLLAEGVNIGDSSKQFIERNISDHDKVIEDAKALMEQFPGRVHTPIDVAVDVDGERREVKRMYLPSEHRIKDIGVETMVSYIKVMEKAKTIIANGPAGVFEQEAFSMGTEEMFIAMAQSTGFTVVGGGETSAVVQLLKLEKQIDHMSTGGGASISYLSGEKMPIEEALIQSKKWYQDGYYQH